MLRYYSLRLSYVPSVCVFESMAVVAYTVQGCLLHIDCLSLEYSVVQLQSIVVRRRMSVELRDLHVEGLGPCK